MRAERAALMPDWPARMDAGMAALYLGIGEDTLRNGASAGRFPAPVHEGGRVLWSKRQLDVFVAGQFGFIEAKNPWDK